jgi:hypothetical protein
MGQRAYCHHEYHPGGDQEADQWCADYHQVRLPKIGKKITMNWNNEKLIEDLNEWAASSTGEHEPPRTAFDRCRLSLSTERR